MQTQQSRAEIAHRFELTIVKPIGEINRNQALPTVCEGQFTKQSLGKQQENAANSLLIRLQAQSIPPKVEW